MSRTPLALIAGILGFGAYVVGVVSLADALAPMHPLAELLYFGVAGVAWALPGRWLLLWAARRR
ncbi:protein of unknown function [Rhodovastum atsumiense]|nr:DUF2842 domain-containing protein [Rhodovastum atsumiense]CAH2600371.1 protein of unknown function [Rhodovastum atsumiense]